jgi:hypothetical protein
MAVRAVPWKEHADEAVENFLIIQIFHRASSFSFTRDSAIGGSRHISSPG